MRPVRIGCSGWMYDSWRGRLYPEKEPKRRWLELYAQHFDTVEVNSTFYRLARREAVAGWVRQTPEDFCFAVKASRYLTHIKRLADLDQGIRRFYEPLEPLLEAGRLGPVLWQLPENFHRDDDRLRGWLDALPPGRHTIEFRHASWFVPEVLDALRSHGVALTIGDHPNRSFQSYEVTAAWRFVRFHYGARGRIGNYSVSEIAQWAARIEPWRQSEEVYVYYNNDWNSYAPANARVLMRDLGVEPYGDSTIRQSRPPQARRSAPRPP
ncbi:MAG: DUF72 domain-containing protein, partial [Actinomycetota bacterium]|nr:DUF72 domain-containing protein [Actinomycetota bacterium]